MNEQKWSWKYDHAQVVLFWHQKTQILEITVKFQNKKDQKLSISVNPRQRQNQPDTNPTTTNYEYLQVDWSSSIQTSNQI